MSAASLISASSLPEHFVQFYRDDAVLIDSMSRYVHQGLMDGAGVIVIATAAHTQAMQARLQADAVDTAKALDEARLHLLDAERTLAKLMVDGTPDPALFSAHVGTLVARTAHQHRRVVAFGEMVGLLWKQGQTNAAVALEQLWNELSRQQPLTLFCAYSTLDCAGSQHTVLLDAVCASHTRVLPEDAVATGSWEQLRALARSQQPPGLLEQRLKQEADVQRQIAHLAAIVDSSDDAIISKTLDGFIQSWNVGAQHLFGWSADEAIGQPITLIVPPERLQEEQHIIATLRRGERIEHFETTRVTKEGRHIEVSLTISPIRNAAGTVIGASKIARDITARNRRELELREREEQLRLATELAEVGFWDLDRVTDTLFWPPRVKAMFGISADVPVSMMDFYSGLHPEDRQMTSEAFAAALDPGRRAVYDVEYRTVGKEDGLIRWVAAKGRGIFDDDGKCVRVLGTAVEITERKRIEALLRTQETALAGEAKALTQLNHWSHRLWSCRELSQGIHIMLDTAIELLGADKGTVQLIGADGVTRVAAQRGFEAEFLDFFNGVAERDGSAFAHTLRSGELVLIEDVELDGPSEPLRSIARAGGYRAVISYPLITAEGTPHGQLSVHFVRPHRPSEPELSRLTLYVRHASDFVQRCKVEQALHEANQRKNVFLALLGHELRNPLAPITNASELLSLTIPHGSRAQPAVDIVKRQTAQLSRLVDDLLDIGRITQGRVQLRRSPIDLGSIVAQAVETIDGQLRQKEQEISIITSTSEALWVNGDFARLVQCVGNILSNAVKYTDAHGKIRLETRADGPNVVIQISDNGAGISPELLPSVFDLFVQSERTLDRAQGGLGIGLSIVKKLVEMHDGEVRASSIGLGHGATFVIRLPRIARPDTKTAHPCVVAHVSPKRVLIVEDNIDGAKSLAMLLGVQGHEVAAVHSGEEALGQIETLKPDVALVDVGLPGMDGYALAQRLRSIPQLGGLRLIALTGYGQTEDRQRALAAGFDEHLTKPVSLPVLERVLAGVQ